MEPDHVDAAVDQCFSASELDDMTLETLLQRIGLQAVDEQVSADNIDPLSILAPFLARHAFYDDVMSLLGESCATPVNTRCVGVSDCGDHPNQVVCNNPHSEQ